MAVPYSNTRLRVPKGFQNVLEGLAREVLRCQPENIYSFAADYFEELLRMRQETGYDDIALLGAKLEDRFYNNHSFKNPNTNTNNEEQQSAAVKIQSEYRRFAAKKEVDTKKEEEAAIVIQASFRGHFERQNQKPNSNEEIDLNNSQINQEDEEIDIDLNDPEVEKAAVKIQSVYKGFRSRKTTERIPSDAQTNQHNNTDIEENTLVHSNIDEPEIMDKHESEDLPPAHGENQNYQEYDIEDSQTMLDESKSNLKENDMKPEELQNSEEIIDIDLTDPDVEKAAVKIQSAFKGFKTRKANEDTPIAPVTNDEENPEEMQTGDESQHLEIVEENLEKSDKVKAFIDEEIIDIDLNDPDVEKAAVKIQSVYKGFRNRKTIKGPVAGGHGDYVETHEKVNEDLEFDHENQEVPTDEITNVTDNMINEAEQITDAIDDSNKEIGVKSLTETEEIDIDLTDPEVSKAALKIQASFKGFKKSRNAVKVTKTHEDNPESGGPTNDTDEAATSRTEPDE